MLAVPRDLSLRVFHRLGTNQLVVSLQILEGDDAFTRILQTFRKAHLPSCFLRPTLEHVALAIRESLGEEMEITPDVVPFDPLPFTDPLLHKAERLPESPLDPSCLQLRGAIPPDLCPWGLQFSSGSTGGSMTFWCAYDFLLRHRPSFFRTIGTLEESYLQAIRELVLGRAVAVSELQRCQSIEMERLRRQSEEAAAEMPEVQVLVGQHVSEIDALERHWQSEIEQLKMKQKASYRGLVVDFFEQEVLGDGEIAATSGPPSVPDDQRNAYLACPLHPKAWTDRQSKAAGSEPEVGEDSRLTKISEVRATFGRNVFFVLRLFVGDVMEFAGGITETSAENDADGAGPQLPSDFMGLESYRCDSYTSSLAACQSQDITIQSAPAMSQTSENSFKSSSLGFWQSQSFPRLQLSPSAYSDRLRALIIPTPANLQFDTVQVSMLRDFEARCQRMTDFHFPPLKDQFEAVKRVGGVFRPGDYFCTRHSNLGRLHAAFHLLVAADAHSADELPASLHRALRRIFSECHRCHVAEVTLPLLLLDIGTSDTSLPFAVAQRRAEQSLRALKSALTELADELSPYEAPTLNVVNLVLPISALQSVAKGTSSVASTTQSFLQNSFQCV
ncbi:unnamed protein product [Cladocopium goreaui]|uniref:Uncharacterized protein C12orf4-like n=1 Tax=Cladocopium goreaui TaxID=2562237 RepID=A0A9P1CR51_9DINO|nr:unnamed protein product [Cladocopium goreaui]